MSKWADYNMGELTGEFMTSRFYEDDTYSKTFKSKEDFENFRFPIKAISRFNKKTNRVRCLVWHENGKLQSRKTYDKNNILDPKFEDGIGFGQYLHKRGTINVSAELVRLKSSIRPKYLENNRIVGPATIFNSDGKVNFRGDWGDRKTLLSMNPKSRRTKLPRVPQDITIYEYDEEPVYDQGYENALRDFEDYKNETMFRGRTEERYVVFLSQAVCEEHDLRI